MKLIPKLLSIITTIISFNLDFLVYAETQQNSLSLEMTSKTPSFQQKVLEENKIKITVDYKPFDRQKESNENNISYQIYYDNTEQIQAATTGVYGQVYLQNLDNNQTSEIIVETYSGGAHCCTSFTIYTWLKDRFVEDSIENLNGRGGIFKDLNGDGNKEFITNDNSFLYQFSSYVGSYPPSLIFDLKEGKLKNNTRNYPEHLRNIATQMRQTIEATKDTNSEINGLLAGYVAQKILLDEYEEAWQFMLKNYDQNSDWGLTMYNNNNEEIGKYDDFPAALKAFLIKQGYLNE